MRPQTRHYIERTIIFERFKDYFSSHDDFMKKDGVPMWKLLGAEIYSRKWYLPGALFSSAPYQLKDAIAFGNFVFSPPRALGTRSAVLYSQNYPE